MYAQLCELNEVVKNLDVFADPFVFYEQIDMVCTKIRSMNVKHFYNLLLKMSPYVLFDI